MQRFTRDEMRPILDPYGLVEATVTGGLIHLAGQTGMDPVTHEIVGGGLRAQAEQAFRNIRAVIELAGGRAENLVSLTWYLVEPPEGRAFMEDALEVTAARETVLPGVKAGSTAVRVKALLLPEILIEIQAVAAL